jgi:hypothetical protein
MISLIEILRHYHDLPLELPNRSYTVHSVCPNPFRTSYSLKMLYVITSGDENNGARNG